MADTGFTVRMSGPLFTSGVTEEVHNAIAKGLLQVALQGQRMVQEQMTPGHGVGKTGTARRSVGGFLQPGSWSEAVVRSNEPGNAELIYMSWLEEGPHGKQPIGRFKGYGLFANARQRLDGFEFNSVLGKLIVEKLT